MRSAGVKKKLSFDQEEEIFSCWADPESKETIREISKRLGISTRTFYRTVVRVEDRRNLAKV